MKIIQQNKVTFAILIYIVMYGMVTIIKPAILFHSDGTLRDFGINSKHTTLLSAWVLSIFLAFLSYIIIMYMTKTNIVEYM